MGAGGFNEMEKDAIGEIMNISLGASATAISTMLGAKANITTPTVRIQTRDEFGFKKLEPAIGVEIAYTEGLEGRNVMIFRKEDVRVIVGILMGAEIPENEFEMDEVTISAICEVMNQMMGSSATALSEFLGTTVNISTPKSFIIDSEEKFKDDYFPAKDSMVVVSFVLEIEGKLKSEFLNIMSMDLARRLLKPFEDTLAVDKEPEIQNTAQSAEKEEEKAELPKNVEEPVKAAETVTDSPEIMQPLSGDIPLPSAQNDEKQSEQPDAGKIQMDQPFAAAQQTQQQVPPQMAGYVQPVYAPPAAMDPVMLQLLTQMQQTQAQMMEMMQDMRKSDGKGKQKDPDRPNLIRPLSSVSLETGDTKAGEEEEYTNQEMLMQVPLEVSVEIGRTKKKVRDILEFTQGSLVVLDKMAGEQVDLFVNGRVIARGDIVVVEDNFGVRITEIVSKTIDEETL